jgi:DNA-binding NtrC family response regulator
MANQTQKWILPPELKKHFDEFLTLYDTTFKNSEKSRPLIIHGEPGVGKSLFTHIFETLYRKDHPEIKDDEVKRVNVSALAPNIIESELFGHEKGAFTGAHERKEGFFKNTKLLILEEIGELEKFLQAKLLTVLEDGYFYPVGQTKKPVNTEGLQVIATTNAALDKHFRQDFLGRCYVFSVPAFRERRGDVLYTLANLYPGFFSTLHPCQVMAILAYHWPDNMREIIKFGTTQQTTYCQSDFMTHSMFPDIKGLFDDMGFGWKKVNNLLHKGNLSLDYFSDKDCKPKFEKIKLKPLVALGKIPDIKLLDSNEEIEKTKKYFWLYTRLICMDIKENVNLLDRDVIVKYRKPYKWRGVYGDYQLYTLFQKQEADKFMPILEKASEYVLQRCPKEIQQGFVKTPDPFSIPYDEMRKTYLAEQLSRSDNMAEAARRSGMDRNTFKYQLIKYHLYKK